MFMTAFNNVELIRYKWLKKKKLYKNKNKYYFAYHCAQILEATFASFATEPNDHININVWMAIQY